MKVYIVYVATLFAPTALAGQTYCKQYEVYDGENCSMKAKERSTRAEGWSGSSHNDKMKGCGDYLRMARMIVRDVASKYGCHLAEFECTCDDLGDDGSWDYVTESGVQIVL